jgi:hypothetical protein
MISSPNVRPQAQTYAYIYYATYSYKIYTVTYSLTYCHLLHLHLLHNAIMLFDTTRGTPIKLYNHHGGAPIKLYNHHGGARRRSSLYREIIHRGKSKGSSDQEKEKLGMQRKGLGSGVVRYPAVAQQYQRKNLGTNRGSAGAARPSLSIYSKVQTRKMKGGRGEPLMKSGRSAAAPVSFPQLGGSRVGPAA